MSVQALLDAPTAAASTRVPTTQGRILAVDLHTHSHHSAHVSKHMTWDNILPAACTKGIDLMSTGDCLQPEWLAQIELNFIETGSGLLIPHPDFTKARLDRIPEYLHRSLHFVLGTEVSCVPPGTPHEHGIHHLLFFRSISSARRFAGRVGKYGNLQKGRPSLRLTSRQLLEIVILHGDGAELAPAHLLTPYHSALGSISGKDALYYLFGDLTAHLLAVEMGLPAIPEMCRSISSLDSHGLLACADAHSLENIGREYTLLDIALTYDALMDALREPASDSTRGFVKLPPEHVSVYWCGCASCSTSYPGTRLTDCPKCGIPLTPGVRARTATLATRPEPSSSSTRQLIPLSDLLAGLAGTRRDTEAIRQQHAHLINRLGSERHILNEASPEQIARHHNPALARLIVQQRVTPLRFPLHREILQHGDQLTLDL